MPVAINDNERTLTAGQLALELSEARKLMCDTKNYLLAAISAHKAATQRYYNLKDKLYDANTRAT